MKLIIYDTKLKEKVELTAADGRTLKMYTCGPTVYNYAHIGNLRTYIFEDLLRRTVLLSGQQIMHVMNITDVDDKTIRKAVTEGVPLKVITSQYAKEFFEDLKVLNIQPAEVYPAATDHVEEMIAMIDSLLQKGYAYTNNDGNVFFRIGKFEKYGCLSGFSIDELKIGASNRVDSDEYDKENLSDFVLWKAYDEERDGDIFWEAPWGRGRPGWHIECSAMAICYLGETIDLHCGGIDNMFPHHENEIAQSEACTHKCFSRHWMHAAHLIVDGKKMSKSLGNFFTLKDLLNRGYSGREIRYLLLTTHYRTQLNFTFEGLDGARHTLRRIDDFIDRLAQIDSEVGAPIDMQKTVNEMKMSFVKELFNDLNISAAMAALFEFIRTVHTQIKKEKIGLKEASLALNALSELDQVLGFMQRDTYQVPFDVEQMFQERQQARKEKNWALADELRGKIDVLGYVIEDSPSGSYVKPKVQ